MQAKLRISLKERGTPQVISREEWANSGCINDTTGLVRLGVIKVSQSGPYLLIEPKTLVGIFDSPRLRLEVAPKSPTLSAGLLKILEGWRKTIDVEDHNRQGNSTQMESVWKTFEALLSDLHREGLPWLYTRKIEISSTPRGRILFCETLAKCLTRGIHHQVVSSAQVRSHIDNLAPALDAVRRKIATLEIDQPNIQSRVARLIDLAGDVSLPISDGQAKNVFNELSGLNGRPALEALVLFCKRELDDGEPFRISQRVGSGIAAFVDLEKLWENAIQMLLELHVSSANERVLLHPQRRSGLRLFDDGGPQLDPDIIIYRESKAVAVVDAKYSLASCPSADDVYQLSSYVSRLESSIGILAYVSEGDETSVQKIGTLNDGRELFACYLSLNAFDTSRRALDSIFLTSYPLTEIA